MGVPKSVFEKYARNNVDKDRALEMIKKGSMGDNCLLQERYVLDAMGINEIYV